MDTSSILEFVDAGHNLLVAASSEVSETVRSLAVECGVDVDERGTKVYDHFSHASLGGSADHTTVASLDVARLSAVFAKDIKVCHSPAGLQGLQTPKQLPICICLSLP